MVATFKKAEPVAMPLKCSFYGPPGSGKTLTSMMFMEGLSKRRGKRFAFVDTELGTKTYRLQNPARKCHPEAFDFDVLNTRSLAEILEAVKSLDPKTHSGIVIDSMSHVWDSAREAWENKNPGAKDIPLRAWSDIKRPYKELMKFLIASPFDVIICGRQKTLFEEENGKLSNVGVAMRAEGETQYDPDICVRFESVTSNGKRGEEEGIVTMFCEKDRYSILSGRTYANPTFKTIEGLIPFLGTATPVVDDEDERASADGELLDQAGEKARDRAAKSESLFHDLQAKAMVASDLQALGAVTAEAKKAKRSMSEEHINALRLVFESRSKDLMSTTVGSI